MPTWTPDQVRMDDGFSTTIEFENAPTIKLYEKEVTPPPVTGGGPIDITTMRNLAWMTKSPKKLKELGQMSLVCAYASAVYPVVQSQLQVNQRILVSFPNGAHLRFWGWLESFSPAALQKGEQPQATVTIVPSLHDTNGTEVAPEYLPPGVGTEGT